MAIAIIFLLPQKPPESGAMIIRCFQHSLHHQNDDNIKASETNFPHADGKYSVLETRPPTFTSNSVHEASFKHYADENGPPEVINVTSSAAGGTILPPDQVRIAKLNSCKSDPSQPFFMYTHYFL